MTKQAGERCSIEEAQALLRKVPVSLRTRMVRLHKAEGCVCAQEVFASLSQPPFDRSPLDGYALRSTDVAGASPENPVSLSVSQLLYAGDAAKPLVPGTAARIMTGAPMPAGADCVIAQENTDCGKETARFFTCVAAGDNVCRMGEDVRAGAQLVRIGERLGFAQIGLIAAQGLETVQVYRTPRVGVLSTGNELVNVGELAPGKIYDTNRAMLCARLSQLGLHARPLPFAPDNVETLCARIREALQKCDLLITTGGVSVGEHDLLPAAMQAAGSEILFHGVAVRPGSPVMAALLAQKPVLCLSGNPFAALATFEVLARPLLQRLAGEREADLPRVRAVLQTGYQKACPQRRLIRATLSGGEVSIPKGGHQSGALASLAGCNCLIDLPKGQPALNPGDFVEVILL